ncbi:hypothetical protein BD779DRAFT_1445631 [Infundibulicybe gibba]|nr:hypothetical protein BD779DRAFT_1445631 [Infundibulicybe gibba]
MSPVALSSVLLLLSSLVSAQQSTFPATPLASKHFASPTSLPEQVDTDSNLIRGGQHGFNICNSTTQNQQSNCQTSFLNSIDDFCLWAPSDPESIVADTEGEMVAWCTKPGHGTRLIPPGALQGVQYMKTPDYSQVVGFIDQRLINLKSDDFGGEMDPHGADLRGNPLGGVIFSSSFGDLKQIIEWHNFMGGNAFCFKVCDPAGPNAAHFCEHIYDRIGCAYNAPNNAQNGTFESCLGDNQDFPGIFTSNGQVMTYTQPAESLGAISSIPYQPKVPASSSCSQFSSTSLYAALATVTNTLAAPTAAPSGSGIQTSRPSGSGAGTTGSKSGAAGATNTSGTSTSGASSLAISGVSIVGIAFAAVFLS